MALQATILPGLHVVQTGLAAYGAYNSYVAITLLQEYEGVSKKAAEWSNEAQNQLDRTRSTQGAGAFAIFGSFAGSLALGLAASSLPRALRFSLSPALLVGIVLARRHIKSFWGPEGGTRVPLPKMGDFNTAQRKTKVIMDVLGWLEYSWVAATLVWCTIA